MNINILLLVCIILYMFKNIYCNRIEGLDCNAGCIPMSTFDLRIGDLEAEETFIINMLEGLKEDNSMLKKNVANLQKKLDACKNRKKKIYSD